MESSLTVWAGWRLLWLKGCLAVGLFSCRAV